MNLTAERDYVMQNELFLTFQNIPAYPLPHETEGRRRTFLSASIG